MSLFFATPDPSAPRLEGRQCTAACETDLDCPSSMHCADREVAEEVRQSPWDKPLVPRKMQFVAELPPGLSRVPRGY